ncbi:MAG: oxygen-independent coproporphyrinogen III oxidase [Gammaproteobacteria bacterium]
MIQSLDFDFDFVRHYDLGGPRYTSYPAVNHFKASVTEHHYRKWARKSNEDPIPRPLSLYVHIPFCGSPCAFSTANSVVAKDHSKVAAYLDHLGREIAMQAALFDNDRIVEQIHYGGGTPTLLSNDEIRKLMAVTRRHFSLLTDDEGDYSVKIDPYSVDFGRLEVLREASFNRLSLGIQDITPTGQKAPDPVHGLEVLREVTESVRKLGFKSINVELVYGLPDETAESFQQTLQAVTEMCPERVALYNYVHLPEYLKPQLRVNETDLPDADETLAILQHSIDHLAGADYVYIGMDHFARPDDELALAQRRGNLQYDFQGYSTHADCDLVGLGVSAISKVCDNYSQNLQELDEYIERIGAGRFALQRGVEPELDDLLRAEIINELICDSFLDIEKLEKKRRISFARHFSTEIQVLLKMQDEGLLTVERKSLQVLPRGRLLVRNICMVFDRYPHNGRANLSRVI